MRTVRLPLLRGALFLIALAAIAFILARGDNPAAATTFEPFSSVSVSDPNPGAAADLTINFSLDAPDSFPNVRTKSTIQFLPRSWGVHTPESDGADAAPVGSIAGTFNALSTLGVMGAAPCVYSIPVPFTMIEATTDTSHLASALDVTDGDRHPSGLGYSGQFADDPDTRQVPGDLGLPLVPFNADEKADTYPGSYPFDVLYSSAYRDVDNNNKVSAGDIRLALGVYHEEVWGLTLGSVVQPGDLDIIYVTGLRAFASNEKHTENVAANGVMDPGEWIYFDRRAPFGQVSYGDWRLYEFGGITVRTTVEDFALPGGVSRYPDFLNQIFPPEVVGEPLARQLGLRSVIGVPVSLNILTFRPGQLPGYPATLGYPNVVILLNPVAPIDIGMINLTSDLCTPLSLTSTNLGISKDNPTTVADEGGYVRLTNPKAEKDHTFTLITTSQPDADNDGIENMLDTCPLDPNIEDDGHGGDVNYGTGPDWDSLDASCDPNPLIKSAPGPATGAADEDQDTYGNRADNCATVANGSVLLGVGYVRLRDVVFFLFTLGELIGPSDQTDTDGDDIGDACEGAESGGPGAAAADQQCVNATDDDGDGYVNDGCPANVVGAESGAQCDNAVDDDGDGKVNDGCPQEPLEPKETGDQCLNDVDDDGDGKVNDGCPTVGTRAESATPIRLFLQPDSVIASSQYSASYTPQNAFDGNTSSAWCTSTSDRAPGNYIEAQFASPQDINSLELTNPWAYERFNTGTITMSNGFSQDITLNSSGGGSFTFPTQTGVTWVRFTGLTQNAVDACFGEFNLNLSIVSECNNATDDDGDGVVNDGCPQFPAQAAEGLYSWSWQCNDAVDNDGDGKVNDGCPAVFGPGDPETGAQCDNAVDDDGDGLVNDGCPAVDPGDYEKTHITGHMHVVTLTQGVPIARHGVKLDDLDGPESVALDGSATFNLSVENKSGSAEDFPVALRVIGGCGAVSGPSTVHVNGDASANADFTVDFSGCAAGEYTVQADACHAGDAAPAGLFGVGPCGGVADGMVDTNPLDDAPRSLTVVVGTP